MVAAEPVTICVSAVVELEEGYDTEHVKEMFLKNLKEYLKTEEAQTEVKYAEVGAVLIHKEDIFFTLCVKNHFSLYYQHFSFVLRKRYVKMLINSKEIHELSMGLSGIETK